jgi:hypothetical protein
VTLVAPSEFAARTWRESTGMPEATVEVVPHGRVRESSDAVTPQPIDDRPTLAFLGYPAVHKGWEVFLQLHPWALSR